MHYMNISKHKCTLNYLSMKEIGLFALFNTFLLIPLKWRLQLKQELKLFKRIQNNIYIISNLFLDFFIRSTWQHSSYSHIPICYNHEIINVINIQNSLLQKKFC